MKEIGSEGGGHSMKSHLSPSSPTRKEWEEKGLSSFQILLRSATIIHNRAISPHWPEVTTRLLKHAKVFIAMMGTIRDHSEQTVLH